MRRLLALGCVAAYLVFGFVAGAAHVHLSADHHEHAHGLHVDHTHVGQSADHAPADRHEPGSPENGGVRIEGDALYLSAMALGAPDSKLRVMPATVSVGGTIDPPAPVSARSDEPPDPLRVLPDVGPARPRAPPA